MEGRISKLVLAAGGCALLLRAVQHAARRISGTSKKRYLLSASEIDLMFTEHAAMYAEAAPLTERARSLLGEHATHRAVRAAAASEGNAAWSKWLEQCSASCIAKADCRLKVIEYPELGPGTGGEYGTPGGVDGYGYAGGAFQHIARDWSEQGAHQELYGPVLKELQEAARKFGGNRDGASQPSVLVPGAALCRLAWECSKLGFVVEANEYSPLLGTTAEAIYNHATATAMQTIYPFVEHQSHNVSLESMYMGMPVPDECPRNHSQAGAVVLTMGDFLALYKSGGPRHRQFDCVVTCFFIDVLDTVDILDVIYSVLGPNGVWINFGPMDTPQLCWEEVSHVAKQIGFEFTTERRLPSTPYIVNSALQDKLHTEPYNYIPMLTVAVKH